MPLQRARRDAGVAQLLRGARRGREPFDAVALALRPIPDGRQSRRLPSAGDPFQLQNLILTREDMADGRPLVVVQMRTRVLDVVLRHLTRERWLRLLARPHDL